MHLPIMGILGCILRSSVSCTRGPKISVSGAVFSSFSKGNESATARVISNEIKNFISCFLEETRVKIVRRIWFTQLPTGFATVVQSFRQRAIISSRILLMAKTPRRTHKSITARIFEGNPKRTARDNFQRNDFLSGGSETIPSRVVSNKPGKV